MKTFGLQIFLILLCVCIPNTVCIYAQPDSAPKKQIQELSDIDGQPVLTKHLPDYENVANRATYILNQTDLRKALGERPIFDLIDFSAGTEAVAAQYPAGSLLLIEYTTPQHSVEADNNFRQRLAETSGGPPIQYRRIGNYSAFVFDSNDEAAAGGLLDQIKYEKDVRWLGSDPFALHRAERSFVIQTSDLFIATVMFIVSGIGLSILGGIIVGIFVFIVRTQKRSAMESFSDAGGMTRLNLDGFTPEVLPERMLKD